MANDQADLSQIGVRPHNVTYLQLGTGAIARSRRAL
jgi:hypothetical protein